MTSPIARSSSINECVRVVTATIEGERNAIANMANTSAVLYHSLPDINWVGFYLIDGNELVLGPFQGNVACMRIGMGRGVCGAAAKQRATIVVPDVDAFADHIVCDSASRSEVVIPIIVDGSLIGVLDVDSPILDRFSPDDVRGLEMVVSSLVSGSDWGWLVTR